VRGRNGEGKGRGGKRRKGEPYHFFYSSLRPCTPLPGVASNSMVYICRALWITHEGLCVIVLFWLMLSLCAMQVEEYSTYVEQVGGIGNTYSRLVVEMVIRPE